MNSRAMFATILLSATIFLSGCGKGDTGGGGTTKQNTMQPNVQSVRSYLVDKNATSQTAALFYNLKMLSKTKYLIGVHENEAIVNTAAGVGEAMYGTDFMFITDYLRNSGSWYVNKQTEIRNKIKEQYKKGEAITMCWHYRNPIVGEPDNFYWQSLVDTNPTQQKIVSRLIPGGANHDRLKASLDILADFANSLVDENNQKIPVIFRPWHEQSGNWFWWGVPHHCTQQEYIKLWQFTVEYLRDTKGVHNFLYVYSPNGNTSSEQTYLNTYAYPGDNYVDILGVDYYMPNSFDTGQVSATTAQLNLVCDLAAKRDKIAAFTETGYDSRQASGVKPLIFTETYAPMIGNAQIAYMMIWSGNHYIPTESYPNFKSYVRNTNVTTARVATSLNTPNMFSFPTN